MEDSFTPHLLHRIPFYSFSDGNCLYLYQAIVTFGRDSLLNQLTKQITLVSIGRSEGRIRSWFQVQRLIPEIGFFEQEALPHPTEPARQSVQRKPLQKLPYSMQFVFQPAQVEQSRARKPPTNKEHNPMGGGASGLGSAGGNRV